MKIKPQNFIVRGTVFPYDVMFSVNQTPKQLIKVLSKSIPDAEEHEDDLTPSGQGRTVQMPQGGVIVMIKPMNDFCAFHGIVAHEIFHACDLILNKAGLNHALGVSDEAYAYLIGWLTQELYENLKTK